jgi:hypothetical protein
MKVDLGVFVGRAEADEEEVARVPVDATPHDRTRAEDLGPVHLILLRVVCVVCVSCVSCAVSSGHEQRKVLVGG